MLYELAREFSSLPGAGLLQYISVRGVLAILTAFLLSLWLGRLLIDRFARLGLREDTDKTDSEALARLHQGKRGTPTMGGLFLIGGMLVSALLWLRFDAHNTFGWPGLLLVAWYAVVGFVDDWVKLRVAGSKGLSKRTKQLWLSAGALLVAWILQHHAGLEAQRGGPQFYVPFVQGPVVALSWAGGLPFRPNAFAQPRADCTNRHAADTHRHHRPRNT